MTGPFYAESDGEKSQVHYIACANDHRFSIEVTNRSEAEAGARELNRVISEVVAATYHAAGIILPNDKITQPGQSAPHAGRGSDRA